MLPPRLRTAAVSAVSAGGVALWLALAAPAVLAQGAGATVNARPAPTPTAATAPTGTGLGTSAAAAPTRVVGDARRGRTRANTCMGCHGIPHYTNAYPTYRVPMLGGQNPEYIVAALKEYQAGERWHPIMHAQASSMTEQDMADLAAFFAKAPRHR